MFTSIASKLRANISIHAATCPRNFLDKAQRHKAGLSVPAKVWGSPTTWQEARASLLAQLTEEGRDDIAITICPCAKAVLVVETTPELPTFRVTARVQYPAWDEKDGWTMEVKAATKADAVKTARRSWQNDGTLHSQQGLAWLKAEPVK